MFGHRFQQVKEKGSSLHRAAKTKEKPRSTMEPQETLLFFKDLAKVTMQSHHLRENKEKLEKKSETLVNYQTKAQRANKNL